MLLKRVTIDVKQMTWKQNQNGTNFLLFQRVFASNLQEKNRFFNILRETWL